jgi:hypothetical protein
MVGSRTKYHPEENYSAIFVDHKTVRFKIDQSKPILPLRYPELLDFSAGSFCTAGCSFCSPGETLIQINPNESIRIDSLKIGDVILNSMDLKETKYDTIEQIHIRNYSGPLVVIELENTTLKLTPNHKVYTSRGEIRADELTINDEIYHID